jgi:Tfp pilus assembly protein PilN
LVCRINSYEWDNPVSTPHRPKLFRLLLGLLLLELAMIAVLTIVLLVELFIDQPESLATAVALLVLAAIATAWLTAVAIGAIRGQAWIRGAAIVWQVLQFAVGLGAVQGVFSDSASVWGWLLIAVAVGTFVLLFAPSVVAHTSERTGTESSGG